MRTTAALAVTLVAAAGVTGIHSIATRGHRPAPIAVAPPSTMVTTSTVLRSTTTSEPAGDSQNLQTFTPVTASSWWAVVADNLQPKSWVVRTVDSGAHWRDVSPLDGYVGSSSFLNADDAWIEKGFVGYPKTAPLYRTSDGGQTWQRVGDVPNGCELQFVDEFHGWCTIIGAALGSESVDLSRTSDGGVTWTRVSRSTFSQSGAAPSTPDAIPVGCDKSVTFTSPTVGWSPFWCNAGEPDRATGALYRSNDGGSTWRALPPIAFPRLPSGVRGDSGSGVGTPVVLGNDVAAAITVGGRPGATGIATSTTGGMTWRTQFVPEPTKQWSVDLIDPAHWRLTDGRVLMATDDEGAHWRTTTLAVNMTDPYGGLNELRFLSTDLGWAIPGVNGGPLSWTTDGGATWRPITITAGPYVLSRALR